MSYSVQWSATKQQFSSYSCHHINLARGLDKCLKKTPALARNAAGIRVSLLCATLVLSEVMPNTCWFLSGRRSHHAASVPWEPQRLERKQLLRNELWLGGRTHFSLTSLGDSSVSTDRFMGLLTFMHGKSKTGESVGVYETLNLTISFPREVHELLVRLW